jgi:hypothetical protein
LHPRVAIAIGDDPDFLEPDHERALYPRVRVGGGEGVEPGTTCNLFGHLFQTVRRILSQRRTAAMSGPCGSRKPARERSQQIDFEPTSSELGFGRAARVGSMPRPRRGPVSDGDASGKLDKFGNVRIS